MIGSLFSAGVKGSCCWAAECLPMFSVLVVRPSEPVRLDDLRIPQVASIFARHSRTVS